MSVLGVAGVYFMTLSTVRRVISRSGMFIISKVTLADAFQLGVTMKVDFFLLGSIAQRRLSVKL